MRRGALFGICVSEGDMGSLDDTYLAGHLYRGFDQADCICFYVCLHPRPCTCEPLVEANEMCVPDIHMVPHVAYGAPDLGSFMTF